MIWIMYHISSTKSSDLFDSEDYLTNKSGITSSNISFDIHGKRTLSKKKSKKKLLYY